MFKRLIKFLLIIFILISSISIISAADTNFTDLESQINNSGNNSVLTLNKNYTWVIGDKSSGIVINNNNFVLDGNGYIINGNNQSRIFDIYGNNVTLKNLIIIHGKTNNNGGGIYNVGNLQLINVSFEKNVASNGGAICNNGNLSIINSTFEDNTATGNGGAIFTFFSSLKVNNTDFINNHGKWATIYAAYSNITIDNSLFINTSTEYAGAIYATMGELEVYNSNFINMHSYQTAGSIALKSNPKTFIKNSTFINSTTGNYYGANAGAIFCDFGDGSLLTLPQLFIYDSTFINCYSSFGGAVATLYSILIVNNSNFINNSAYFDGGAIYSSYGYFSVNNSNFIENKGIYNFTGRSTEGGAIFLDKLEAEIENSIFENNSVGLNGGAIFAYDIDLRLFNNIFKNNNAKDGSALYVAFGNDIDLINNSFNNDSISLNNTPYAYIVLGEGTILELVNNSIILKNFPSKFDLRDFGWLTPVRDQGVMGACWTFGSIAALESALLKATNIEYDFSENNMQAAMLQYSIYGRAGIVEGGLTYLSVAYLLSWFGAFPEEYDTYDQLGKLSPLVVSDIHIQDIIFIPPRSGPNDNDLIKDALIKYGAIDTCINWDSNYYNANTSSFYYNGFGQINHDVCIVGWDDNYSKNNFLITPPGNGAFIVRNSWGTSWADGGYFYVSYYDTQFANCTSAAYLINNTVNYNKNYQYDISGLSDFNKLNEDVNYYSNQFVAIESDLIAAVGTYFQEISDYELFIYVNDKLITTQSGTSAFAGYNTIKLNHYVLINENDTFKVTIKTKSIPYMENSRIHLQANTSFASSDGINWFDLYDEGVTACLKVYTIQNSILAEDLEKYYKNGTGFVATLLNSNGDLLNNTNISMTINGVTYIVLSDENGTIKLDINLNPGEYILTIVNPNTELVSSFNVNVLSTLIADNLIKYFLNDSQFNVTVLGDVGNELANTNVTFNINGVLYIVTTNQKGIATLPINLNPGTYIITIEHPNGQLLSKNITVLETLTGYDLNKTFGLSATYDVKVLNGIGDFYPNQKVSININGIFYEIISDNEGIARLPITLNPGSYIATATWNNYSTSNLITVFE